MSNKTRGNKKIRKMMKYNIGNDIAKQLQDLEYENKDCVIAHIFEKGQFSQESIDFCFNSFIDKGQVIRTLFLLGIYPSYINEFYSKKFNLQEIPMYSLQKAKYESMEILIEMQNDLINKIIKQKIEED